MHQLTCFYLFSTFVHTRLTTRLPSMGERLLARLYLDAVVRRPHLIRELRPNSTSPKMWADLRSESMISLNPIPSQR
jgi:hypothetical protein